MGFDPSSSLPGFLGHFSKFLFMFLFLFLSHLSLYLSTHFHSFTSLLVKSDVNKTLSRDKLQLSSSSLTEVWLEKAVIQNSDLLLLRTKILAH